MPPPQFEAGRLGDQMAPAFVNLTDRYVSRDPKLCENVDTGSTLTETEPGDSGPSLGRTKEVAETLATRPLPQSGPARVVYVSQGAPRDVTHAPKVRRRLLVRGEAHSGEGEGARA
eukprot:7377304-Prymnesium_polylepis.1